MIDGRMVDELPLEDAILLFIGFVLAIVQNYTSPCSTIREEYEKSYLR
jgi:hypothetical protein